MGLFKKIVTTYRTVKQGKKVCCQNLSEVRDRIDLEKDEWNENLHLDTKEKYEEMYIKYKTKGVHKDPMVLLDCLDGKAVKKDHDENYKKFVEQKIKETDEGKITHEEFFDAIYSR